MKVKPNIGMLNSLVRIMIGLTIVAWGTAKLAKKPWRDSYLVMIMLGAMKVAEGIVRYCPVTDLYQNYQQDNGQGSHHNGQSGSRESMEGLNEDDVLPYSPS